jgi:hypothetical protein
MYILHFAVMSIQKKLSSNNYCYGPNNFVLFSLPTEYSFTEIRMFLATYLDQLTWTSTTARGVPLPLDLVAARLEACNGSHKL